MNADTQHEREYDFNAADFDRVRKLIYARAGINLNATKQNMVYSRLSRRLRTTGMNSFADYLNRLETSDSSEWQEFINALTTNLTSFFREAHHFPVLADFVKAHGQRSFRAWCAASSTGEEPYSIAMTIAESLPCGSPSAHILATDIDTNVLNTARRGVYREDQLKGVSEERRRRFLQRGSGANEGMVRVRPELTRMLEFKTFNLISDPMPKCEPFDVIFCRNVMIYFDKPTQRKVLMRLASILRPGGLLFVGHSENFTDCRETLELRGKTVYQRLHSVQHAA